MVLSQKNRRKSIDVGAERAGLEGPGVLCFVSLGGRRIEWGDGHNFPIWVIISYIWVVCVVCVVCVRVCVCVFFYEV